VGLTDEVIRTELVELSGWDGLGWNIESFSMYRTISMPFPIFIQFSSLKSERFHFAIRIFSVISIYLIKAFIQTPEASWESKF
jgi:hypothetical protein